MTSAYPTVWIGDLPGPIWRLVVFFISHFSLVVEMLWDSCDVCTGVYFKRHFRSADVGSDLPWFCASLLHDFSHVNFSYSRAVLALTCRRLGLGESRRPAYDSEVSLFPAVVAQFSAAGHCFLECCSALPHHLHPRCPILPNAFPWFFRGLWCHVSSRAAFC